MKMKQYFAMACVWIVSLLLLSYRLGQIIGPTMTPSPTITPTRVTQTFTINVPANAHWFDTGIKIDKGQYVEIQATGNVKTWGRTKHNATNADGQTTFFCDDSRCHLPRAYYGELTARFASGTPFRIYTVFDFIAPVSGALFLSFKEWSIEDKLSELIVIVTVK